MRTSFYVFVLSASVLAASCATESDIPAAQEEATKWATRMTGSPPRSVVCKVSGEVILCDIGMSNGAIESMYCRPQSDKSSRCYRYLPQ